MCAWKSRMGLFAIRGPIAVLPDPRAVLRRKIERVARLYLERRVPGVDVSHHAVHAVLPPAVRIADRQVADELRRGLAGPRLRPAEENALVTAKAVDHWRRLALQRRVIGVEAHGEATEIGDVLAHRQAGIDVHARHW